MYSYVLGICLVCTCHCLYRVWTFKCTMPQSVMCRTLVPHNIGPLMFVYVYVCIQWDVFQRERERWTYQSGEVSGRETAQEGTEMSEHMLIKHHWSERKMEKRKPLLIIRSLPCAMHVHTDSLVPLTSEAAHCTLLLEPSLAAVVQRCLQVEGWGNLCVVINCSY